MRAFEFLKKQLTESTLITDVPNEDWLNSKIEYAKEKGRDSFSVPYMGTTTGYLKDTVRLPVSLLKTFPGMRGEQKNVRPDDLRAIKKIMKDTGKLPVTKSGEEYAPFILVAYNGEAWVSEGNHRIMAAAELGWDTLPVELKYFDGGERVKSGPLYPEKIGLNKPTIDEGINDPAIFKTVFIIGGPGSGKSFITQKLGLSALGYTTINSDIAFEYLMKKHNIDPKMPPEEKEKRDIVRQRAKDITGEKSNLAIDGRLGIVIDGTGDDYEKISKLKTNFDMLGYDNYLVVVNTNLEVARKRNKLRQRTVPDEIVVDSWYAVQNNIGKFSNEFENVSIIDNSGEATATDKQVLSTYKKIVQFTNTPPNKPQAKNWIKQQQNTNEAAYAGNLGAMEMFKFRQMASPELWALMKKLISQGKEEEAWELLKKVTGVKLKEAEKRTPASIEIRQNLRAGGYKLLGSGADATVWAKKEGPVIKIIMPDDGQGAGVAGDTFMKFYEFCKEHSGYENLPRFSDNEVEVFQADGKDYIMVTMERLSPIPGSSFQEAMVWILSDLATKKLSWEQAKEIISDENTWFGYESPKTNPETILRQFDSLDDRDLLEYEVLYKLMVLLYHRGRINKIGWDLHTENAMMRGDTIVITDPWFNMETKT